MTHDTKMDLLSYALMVFSFALIFASLWFPRFPLPVRISFGVIGAIWPLFVGGLWVLSKLIRTI